MPYNESLAQQIRSILAHTLSPHIFEEEVVEKKMFGGLAFMIREMEKQVLPRKGACVTLMKGRLYHGYIDLDTEGQRELPYWIDLALAYNQELA